MTNLKYLSFLILSILIAFTSCRDDEDQLNTIKTPVTVDDPSWGVQAITGSLAGQVFELNNSPIANAEVSVNGQTQTTDENGVFIFPSIEMNALGTVVKVSSDDHFNYSKVIDPKDGKQTIINFGMHRKDNSKMFNTSEGTSINVSATGFLASVELPGGPYVIDGTDVPFEGIAVAYLTFINPASEEHQASIPGDLRAIDENGEKIQLASFSMVGVEIYNELGDKLNLGPDQEATINFPIPSELQNKAPETLPLWVYNEENGNWEEEGEAVKKVGNFYEGKVSHFSFWNCDAPFPLVELQGKVLDENGIGISGIKVLVEVVSSGIAGVGWTNSEGIYEGKVPKDEKLILYFSKGIPCEEFETSIEVGPLIENTVLEDYKYPYPDALFNTLSGRLLNCEGELTVDGYLRLEDEFSGYSLFVMPNDDGYFSVEIPNCWTSFTLTGFDFVGGYISEPITWPNGIEEDTDINDYLLCTEILTYFTLEYNGDTYRNDAVHLNVSEWFEIAEVNPDSVNQNLTVLVQAPLGMDGEIALGDVMPFQINFTFEENGVREILLCEGSDGCEMIINIESAQPAGGFVTGTMDGTLYQPSTGNTVDASGEFRAYRFR